MLELVVHDTASDVVDVQIVSEPDPRTSACEGLVPRLTFKL